jgi:DNA-binding NarL/FixJ family response regulator
MLVELTEQLHPDVVLLELDGQEEDFLPDLDNSLPIPALVVLVDDLQTAILVEFLQAGVRGVLPKEAIANDIAAAIEAAAAGFIVLHPDVVEVLLPALPTPIRPSAPPVNQSLTPREIEVLEMLAEGLGNKAIARRLSISEHTVKFHISSIFSKLNVSSRTEAVTLGARLGMILL